MHRPADAPVILFDGVCNLCNRLVTFIIARDPAGTFRFASLQSPAGRELLERAGMPADALETVVLVVGDRAYTRSTAAIRIARLLGGAWRLAAILRFIPRPLRDLVYDWVARNRYRIWGRRDECMIPSPGMADRFLE